MFSRSGRRRALSWIASLALLVPAPAAAQHEVDLVGTWFVLIHYRDSATANPDSDRWQDKVWTFEKRGTRLQWAEYPIVVFQDTTGRFEAVGANRRARTLVAWEPNESQLAQIVEGPRVNSRGSKTKTLKGSPQKGYQSFGQLRTVSASVIGYHEVWSIDQPTTLPVFTRDDIMGSGRPKTAGGDKLNLEGRTQYVTKEVTDGGNTLSGVFVRDESRTGVFRMMRAGDVQGLRTDGRTPNEKARDRFEEQLMEEVERRLQEGDPETIRAVEEGMRDQRENRP